jgi:hypothetical protein
MLSPPHHRVSDRCRCCPFPARSPFLSLCPFPAQVCSLFVCLVPFRSVSESFAPPLFCLGVSKLFRFRSIWFGIIKTHLGFSTVFVCEGQELRMGWLVAVLVSVRLPVVMCMVFECC